MRRLASALICMTILVSPVFAVGEIGPIRTSNSQTELCMVKCSYPQDNERGLNPTCDFVIEWLDEDGDVLLSKNFFNVPDQGSRKFAFAGTEKLVSCRAESLVPERQPDMGAVQEPSLAMLDTRGEITALMTNDRAMSMNAYEYCPACTDICIECVNCEYGGGGGGRSALGCISCTECNECLNVVD